MQFFDNIIGQLISYKHMVLKKCYPFFFFFSSNQFDFYFFLVYLFRLLNNYVFSYPKKKKAIYDFPDMTCTIFFF